MSNAKKKETEETAEAERASYCEVLLDYIESEDCKRLEAECGRKIHQMWKQAEANIHKKEAAKRID